MGDVQGGVEMKIRIVNKGEEALVLLDGRIDSNVVTELEKGLLDATKRFDRLTLDFTRVPYISSAGLRLLVILDKTMKRKSGSFVLRNVRDDVMDVFNITGFSRLLDFCE